MLIRIDEVAEGPLHAQIAAQVRRAVHQGEVSEGERLPPVRRLADGLGVNMHTVLRAYRQLESEGVIELRQGRGATVSKGGRRRARELTRFLDRLIDEARSKGMAPAQLSALIGGHL